MAVVGGETVVRNVSHDRCPKCAIGAAGGGLFNPEFEVTTHGDDPRLASGGKAPTLEGRAHVIEEDDPNP